MLPTVPVPCQVNSVHASPNDFFQIQFHIIVPAMHKLQSGFFPSKSLVQPKFFLFKTLFKFRIRPNLLCETVPTN